MPKLPENPAFVLISKATEDALGGNRLSLRQDGKGGFEIIAVEGLLVSVFLTGLTRDDLKKARDGLTDMLRFVGAE